MFERTQSDSKHMEELCCVSVLGELSADEQRTLEAHLAECGDCRELRREFEKISKFDLPVYAADRSPQGSSVYPKLGNPERVLTKVMERSKHLPIPARAASFFAGQQCVRNERLVHHAARTPWALALAAVTVLCVSVGVLAFRARSVPQPLGPQSNSLQLDPSRIYAAVEPWKQKLSIAEDEKRTLQEQLGRLRTEDAKQVSAVNRLQLAYQTSLSQQAFLEQQLSEENLRSRGLESELSGMRTSLAQEQQDRLKLSAELKDASERSRAGRVEAVSVSLPSVSAAQAPSASSSMIDAEARELFGARDLHIVDVYDIDRSGKTKRTYGRVYFADHQLLLFYAFDLAQKERDHALASFQAWGYRGPNSTKPESLGLFYVDDASVSRWALRVTDVGVLSRIDSVFVTLEPPHGSPYPRGRKLLFASLAGPPNHP